MHPGPLHEYAMKTCLICDDHALVREALVGSVHLKWPDTQILEAGDFPSAWIKAQTQPDLCIADLVMPGASPLEGIQGIMNAAPHTPILIVTGTEDDNLLLALLKCGVSGFAPKSASGAIIEAAINLILAGGRYLPSRLADIAASRLDASAHHQRSVPLTNTHGSAHASLAAHLEHHPHVSHGAQGQTSLLDFSALTPRQIDVLRLVSEGHSNKEIARVLGVAPSTVKTHLENLLDILGVANRTEASAKARQLRII